MTNPLRKTAWGLLAAGMMLVAPASAQEPYEQPDDTWISIDGTVEEVSADRFNLDYGDGVIIVEMDDGDRDADAYKLVEGDKVQVWGKIDDDFLEVRTIEASSVYVENLGTTFYASSIDEEDFFVPYVAPLSISRTVLQGTVTSVSDHEFKLDTGLREITVEVDGMAYDPLDDTGYQKIEAGDYVSVTGWIDNDLFEGRELEAEYVTTLYSNDAM